MGKGKELNGQKKKKAKANVDRERQSPVRALRAKFSAKCVGDLVVQRINKTSDLSPFNFSIVVAQVSPRCVGMKIRFFFSLSFAEVIVKIPTCSF